MPIPNCPACQEQRIHTAEDWKFHPLKGEGFIKELGFTSPEAESAHLADIERSKAAKP